MNDPKPKRKQKEAYDDPMRLMPNSPDLEKLVLGTIIISPETYHTASTHIFSEVFYHSHHQIIWDAITELNGKGKLPDMINLIERLRQLGKLEEIGGAVTIARLTDKVISSTRFEEYILTLLQYWMQREMIQAGAELKAKAYDEDPFDLNSKMQSRLTSIHEQVLRGKTSDLVKTLMNIMEKRATQVPGQMIGIDCGFFDLNKLLSGLCAPDLIIIAARPSAGKTVFALNIFRHITMKLNIPAAFFSLEMSAEQLINRVESAESGIWHDKIRKNDLTDDQRHLLGQVDERIANAPIYIDDTSAITITELRAKASIMKRKYGIQALFVDYLQLMRGSVQKNGNREGEISEISRGLKALAKELSIPVIALSQLSRAVESRADKKPQLSDLRESGAIEQDADVVMMLMRPAYYKMTEAIDIGGQEYHPDDLLIVDVAKGRNSGIGVAPLRTILATQTITDYEKSLPYPGNWIQLQD